MWVYSAGYDDDLLQVQSQWWRMEDAPFTPRAEMNVLWYRTGLHEWLLAGGQTGHACGLREFGICSNEAWGLNLRWNATTGTPVVVWNSRSSPDLLLPFSPRCDAASRSFYTAAVSEDGTNYIGHDQQHHVLVGGQLSYDDSTCQSLPATVSEVWHGWCLSGPMEVLYCTEATRYIDPCPPSSLMWRRLPDAPFEPRRGAVEDQTYWPSRPFSYISFDAGAYW